MLNDNHQPQPATQIFALYGLPDRANRCPCGSFAPFVDGHNFQGRRGPFYVWCSECGCTGPERASYNDALAAWNRATTCCDLSEIRMVPVESQP